MPDVEVEAVPPFRHVPTGTPLDAWLGGGLPLYGLTQVRAPVAAGKSTFLLALAEGIHDRDPHTSVLIAVGPGEATNKVSPRSWLVLAQNIEDLASKLEQKTEPRVVLVDDVDRFPSESRDFGAGRRTWMGIFRRERPRRLTMVVAGTVRRTLTPGPSRLGVVGAGFMADVLLDLEPVARTRARGGMVVEATLSKCRTLDAETHRSLILWLRPGHKPPMTLA